MHPSTKILYLMHGAAPTGEERHHVGVTTVGRFAERKKEHRKARDEPFDIWAKANNAYVVYTLLKFKPMPMEEKMYNLLYDLSEHCALCNALRQPIPF